MASSHLPVCLQVANREAPEPSVCFFPACRQLKCDREMLARYRQALETAVNLSVKHSLPPLPGRTLLVYLTDASADRILPKSNPQGVRHSCSAGGFFTTESPAKPIYFCGGSIYLFTYVAVPGLSCGMQNLLLQHVGSTSLTRD